MWFNRLINYVVNSFIWREICKTLRSNQHLIYKAILSLDDNL